MVVKVYKALVKQALETAVANSLENCGAAAEAHAKEYCPVKTGNLRDSLRHEAEDTRTEVIGTDVPYSKYVELGHFQQPGRYVPAIKKRLVASYVRPYPFLQPALERHKEEYIGIIEKEFNGGD